MFALTPKRCMTRRLASTLVARIDRVKTRLLPADAPGAVEEAATALANGELVAFPTDTVYGLAAGHDQLRKLYVAKDRPKDKRIPVLLAYWTAWVDPQGRMNFRRDLYGQDAKWAQALEQRFAVRARPLFHSLSPNAN